MLNRSISTQIAWGVSCVMLLAVAGCGNNQVNQSVASSPSQYSAQAWEVTKQVHQYIKAVDDLTREKNNSGWTADEINAIEKDRVVPGTKITHNLSTFIASFSIPEYRSQQDFKAIGLARLSYTMGEIPYRIGRHQCHLYLVKANTWLISDTDCTSPRLRGLGNNVFKGIFQ